MANADTMPPSSAGRWLDKTARNAVVQALSQMRERVVIEEVWQHEGISASARIRVHDPRFYREVILRGSLGAADTYRKGYWDAEDLTELFRIFLRRRGQETPLEQKVAWLGAFPAYLRHLLRSNNRLGAKRNIQAHYDLGNDFFEMFLDPTLTYSSGIFEPATVTLQEASKLKLRRICDKLGLQPGMRVAEIGCGWGSFAILAAREYGCHITSVTLSQNQYNEARRRVLENGLESQIDLRLMDYRDLEGTFDRLASIEMIEAIGHARLPEYFAKCSSLLSAEGAIAIQAITMPDQVYPTYLRSTDVIREYLFPGSNCPSRLAILNAATLHSDLRLTHLEEIGSHYATTLRHWRTAFLNRLDEAREMGYSTSFLRLWHFYLCYCEAGFAEHYIGNVQVVFAKPQFQEREQAHFVAQTTKKGGNE
jgi:cyclopropane-fatty-acyl-phospholipid synthase